MTRLATVALAMFSATFALAGDWPHWLGPASNGSSPETGLLTTWPEKGPKVLWKIPGGDGYSSIAIKDGKAFTLVQRDGQELAIALDAAKGDELWKTPLGPGFKNNFGNGPRSTPWAEREWLSCTNRTVCPTAASKSRTL